MDAKNTRTPESTALEWAREYVKSGFSVIPLRPRDKKPALDSWTPYQTRKPTDDELVQWFGNGSTNNLGVVTGAISGIAVVDLDSKEAVQFARKHNFPLTPLVQTGKGYHGYYLYREGVRNFQKRDDLPGIDLRGDGGYVVAPPSVHPSGKIYRWAGGKGLENIPFAEIPPIVLSNNGEGKAPLAELYQGVPRGDRNQSLARLCGSWANDGLSFEECMDNARIWNEKNAPPLPEREIQATVRSIYERHRRERRGRADVSVSAAVDGLEADPEAGIVTLDGITPEPVEWLWASHLPYGKITLIDGDPGLGKSHIALDLIARVTGGLPMPDGTASTQGGAVILTVEDGLADTVVPRLMVAGADLSKAATLKFVLDADGNPRFPTIEDVERIEYACRKVGARLVVIDPLMAHLHHDTNSHRDQDIRQAMTPLANMADRCKVAVVVIRHLNKSAGTQAVYRGGGSIGIIGACRCAYLIAKDPEDENRRIFAGIKNNLAPVPDSLSFAIEGISGSSRVVWGGISGHSADTLLAVPSSPEERSALDEAKAFLEDVLMAGPVDANEIKKQAKGAMVNERTLFRAKKALDVKARKQGYQGKWTWELPFKDCQAPPKDDKEKLVSLCSSLATFEDSGADTVDSRRPPDRVGARPSEGPGGSECGQAGGRQSAPPVGAEAPVMDLAGGGVEVAE